MLETVQAGESDYILLLDDDVEVEPESIRRAVHVRQLLHEARDRRRPHVRHVRQGEAARLRRGHPLEAVHLGSRSRRTGTTSASRTCGRPRGCTAASTSTTTAGGCRSSPSRSSSEVGLSLPVFIKWDDAEYSLRAREAGYPTVSLPGAAVWHVSWVDKDDSHDWQAFFHARNRLVAALLHSPYKKGGRLVMSNLANDIRYVLTLDYYAVTLRQLAYESVLAGPGSLHGELKTRLPSIRGRAGEFRESVAEKDPAAFAEFPPTAFFGPNPMNDGTRPTGSKLLRVVARNSTRHWFRKVDPRAIENPQTHLPHNTPWWKMPSLDSFLMSNAEGSGVTWHVRDRATFRSLISSSIRRNRRIRREWATLSADYRSNLDNIVSAETWADTLGVDLEAIREKAATDAAAAATAASTAAPAAVAKPRAKRRPAAAKTAPKPLAQD